MKRFTGVLPWPTTATKMRRPRSAEALRDKLVNWEGARQGRLPSHLDQSAATACLAFAMMDSMFSPRPLRYGRSHMLDRLCRSGGFAALEFAAATPLPRLETMLSINRCLASAGIKRNRLPGCV